MFHQYPRLMTKVKICIKYVWEKRFKFYLTVHGKEKSMHFKAKNGNTVHFARDIILRSVYEIPTDFTGPLPDQILIHQSCS